MITQIEIDGFKTFKDFKVELAPFQVIVGPNGSGKSNLFDALELLSRLAETDLRSAFQGLRGDAGELFTKLPHKQTSNRTHIAVEMLVDRKVQDDLGRKAELKYTRLRYELEIIFYSDEHGPDQLHVAYESLKSILPDEDTWCKKYGLSSQNNWLRTSTTDQATLIDTKPTSIDILESIEDKTRVVAEHAMIYLYSDGDEPERIKRSYAMEVQRTMLSTEVDTDHPHVFAAREELRSLKFLHLNPEVLRQPSSTKSPRFLAKDGGNLPATLVRMRDEDKFALVDVSRDMANLVPGILKIRVERDKASDKYVIYAETSDRRSFSSQVLSDGTLRLLALATLRNDPQFHGVLCLEEPENGVHPFRLKNMTHLLRETATDFRDSEQTDEPLRQVLVTTHSPAFISQPDVVDSLLFAYAVTRVEPLSSGNPSLEITCMTPVVTPNTQFQPEIDGNEDKAMEVYTIDQVKEYLDSEGLDKARERLEKARTTLNEG